MSSQSHTISWPNLRQRRAEMLTAMILRQIESVIRCDAGVNGHEYAARKLMDFFSTVGVEVVTDFDRAASGLPPRNRDGYTAEEMCRLEAEHAAAMLGPFPAIYVPK